MGGEGTRDREGVTRGGGSGRNSGSGSGDSTLTAASLIDAIITHQINQSSTDSPGSGTQGGPSNSPVPTRPGDRLFQVNAFSRIFAKLQKVTLCVCLSVCLSVCSSLCGTIRLPLDGFL